MSEMVSGRTGGSAWPFKWVLPPDGTPNFDAVNGISYDEVMHLYAEKVGHL